MARKPSLAKRLTSYIQTHKKRSILGGVLLLGGLIYAGVFFIPKPVQFSYAGNTCVRQLTLFPGIHKATENNKFKVSFKGGMKIGSTSLVSTKTCFTPTSEPTPGDARVATAPFGGIVARKQFTITVPAAPVARTASLEKPLLVSKPLEIELSQPDAVFKYQLKSEKSTASCEKSEKGVSCDVPAMNLKQGKQYSLKLTRQFKSAASRTLIERSVRTLRAVTIKKASVKNKQTVYSKPTAFSFVTDKPLARADATLVTTGKRPKDIPVKAEVKGKKLLVRMSKQLARETKYQLIIKQAEATDGSTLVEPEKITFTMSGGPKVTGINIGNSRVGSSAVATVQFDQKLSGNVDIRKYVNLKGGNAVITKHGSSVSIALQGLPRCKAFTISVGKGLPSKYGIKSSKGWSFGSRTTCHSLYTYGTSVQGRPLTAYVFGNTGPVTMYVGAIHGNEPSSSGLMQAWINELETHPDRLSGKQIVVVPTINPDGLAAGTRTNSRGVNLNRNFPTDNWQKDIDDTDGKHKNGGGKNPLSEPEAKALATLTQQYHPRLLLSFHAVGSLVQGDPGSPSSSYAAKYASMVGYSNATGNGDTFDYGITGGYEQWAWSNAGIPSMVIELGSYSSYYIDHHKAALWAML